MQYYLCFDPTSSHPEPAIVVAAGGHWVDPISGMRVLPKHIEGYILQPITLCPAKATLGEPLK